MDENVVLFPLKRTRPPMQTQPLPGDEMPGCDMEDTMPSELPRLPAETWQTMKTYSGDRDMRLMAGEVAEFTRLSALAKAGNSLLNAVVVLSVVFCVGWIAALVLAKSS
jgi:hypothetical protein